MINTSSITSLNESKGVSNSNFLDYIQQLLINLENEISNDEATKIIKDLLQYLFLELDPMVLNDILTIVQSCFSHMKQIPVDLINQILETSTQNSNYIILTTTISNKIKSMKKELNISQLNFYVNETFRQIYSQISKPNEDKFIIFNHEIPNFFKPNFVIDSLLLVKLNVKILEKFYPFIWSHRKILPRDKIEILFKKITTIGLFSTIPKPLLFFYNHSFTANFIEGLSDQEFIENMPLFEVSFQKDTISHKALVLLVERCYKLNIKIAKINYIISSLQPQTMDISFWKYFAKYNIKLPIEVAVEIVDFPDPVAALKVMPNLKIIPIDELRKGLLEIDSFQLYQNIFDSNIDLPKDVFSLKKFWINVLTVVFVSKEKCPDKLMDYFIQFIKDFVQKYEIFDIIKAMIINRFPTTDIENKFLSELLNKLESFLGEDDFNNNMSNLFEYVVNKRMIPYPSFWELFNSKQINKFYENDYDYKNTILIYAYEFSNLNQELVSLKKVAILEFKKFSDLDTVLELLDTSNTDVFVRMNETSLSLVMSAISFAFEQDSHCVSGLSRKEVLPFYAIAFHISNSDEKINIDSPSIISDLQEACDLLSIIDPPILITSLNIILQKMSSYCNSISNNYNKVAVKMVDVLIPQLLNNSYKADKLILLELIFNLSFQSLLTKEVKTLFEKYGVDLFIYMIQNYKKLSICNKLKSIKLSLDAFNNLKISNTIIDLIQNSKSIDTVIDTLNFIQYFVKSIPPYLKFNNPQNLLSAFKISIENKKWDDLLLLGNIMNVDYFKTNIQQFFNDSIPICIKENIFNANLFKLNSIIINVLNDSDIVNNNKAFEEIFNILMSEHSNIVDYLTILFEKISNSQILEPKSILKFLNDDYQKYKDLFINSISRCYDFHTISRNFIRKTIFQSITNPISKTATAMISILYEKIAQKKGNYQAFYCLLNISSAFPFLFTQNCKQLFNIVLQALDSFSLYYTLKNNEVTEELLINVKTSITALVFLISTLYSVKTINAFVPWLFENILDFSESQIMAFFVILLSLFGEKKINKIMFSLSIKYNFIEKVYKLLDRQIPKNLHDDYKKVIYEFLVIYYQELNKLTKKQIIYVDELSKISDPFIFVFNNLSTIDIKIIQLKLDFPQGEDFLENLEDYIISVSEIKSFYINKIYIDREESNYVSDFGVELFLLHFIKLKKLSMKDPSLWKNPQLDFQDKVMKYRYLIKQPKWVYKWIIKGKEFPLFDHHKTTLLKVLNELKIINESQQNPKDEIKIDDININDYFILKDFNQAKLFNIIINDAINNEKALFSEVILLADIITKNYNAMKLFLDCIYSIALKNIKPINLLLKIMLTISNNDGFKDNFNENFCNYLIDIGLSKFRKNSEYLSNVSKLYQKSNQHFSNRVIHLIGFMFLLEQQKIIPDALALCSDLDYQKLSSIIHVIDKSFEKELNNKNPSYLIINEFMEHIPLLAKQKMPKYISLLNKLLITDSANKNENSINLVFILINFLSPKRNENHFILNNIDFSHSCPRIPIENSLKLQKSQKLKLNKASNGTFEMYPDFFRQYERYRKSMNDMIENSEDLICKLKFIQDFPELVNFKARLKYFNKKMNDKINKKQKINLVIDRSNVLESSFKEINKFGADQLLNKIKVKFFGEDGIDDGGLTCEWFSLIVKEILNPKNGLFRKSENKHYYQPNPYSNSNEKHIEYFKFAGKIIARSLIECQRVNAHFSKSFLRQLLNQNIKFDDLDDFDEDIYNSLHNLIETDVDLLELDFTIDVKDNDNVKTILLNENGDKIKVTNENKKEYISLYTNYHLKKSIIKQINAFKEGFFSLIKHEEINLFCPDELDYLICGSQIIDVNDLQENTQYEYPYHEKHPVIKMFFNVISRWDNEKLKKFLTFLTGSSQVPINGFVEYKERGKPIKIESGGDEYHLCVAHTCFNTLDLPKYRSEEEMNHKLLQSIEECIFGIK